MLLKLLRKKKKFSQKEFAELLRVSQQAVARWENGSAMPQAEKLPEIAKILGCTIDDLFDKEG